MHWVLTHVLFVQLGLSVLMALPRKRVRLAPTLRLVQLHVLTVLLVMAARAPLPSLLLVLLVNIRLKVTPLAISVLPASTVLIHKMIQSTRVLRASSILLPVLTIVPFVRLVIHVMPMGLVSLPVRVGSIGRMKKLYVPHVLKIANVPPQQFHRKNVHLVRTRTQVPLLV
jgi:hypothetical protein